MANGMVHDRMNKKIEEGEKGRFPRVGFAEPSWMQPSTPSCFIKIN